MKEKERRNEVKKERRKDKIKRRKEGRMEGVRKLGTRTN